MSFVVTVGNFDGLHLGHQKLFLEMKRVAEENKMKTFVVTFDRRPLDVLEKRKSKSLIDDKVKALKDFGIDEVLVYSFDDIKHMSAYEFLEELFLKMKMSFFFTTSKLRMGSDLLNTSQIASFLKSKAVNVIELDLEEYGGEVVSSSLIRSLLKEGDVTRVRELMGDYYQLEGEVQAGENKGEKIGFPTANVGLSEERIIPKDGAYITIACVDGEWYPSMSFLGTSSLKESSQRTLEVHIIDFEKSVYQKKIQIKFINFLRENRKFENFEGLKSALLIDRKKTITFFENNHDIIGQTCKKD